MRIFLVFLLSAILAAAAAACSGISDDDLANLQKENEALAAELELEKRQAEILNRALTGVYKERDRLVDQINLGPAAAQDAQAAADGTLIQPGEGGASASSPRVYVVVVGDTLGAIARRFNTTVPVLLTLNPFLRSRADFMVWEHDNITLPR
ncbi:MAG: LysM peptidoglycan-binding domain-containing protein [Deltaproteobacteria bacterium]|nr:LysM peptidoglycan-binding domain-containing protein [Deltaproteobacteria bacterium]